MARRTLAERFWEKVNKDGPTMPGMDTPCWEWTGTIRAEGYGTLSVPPANDAKQAHRVSWELNVGPIPAGLFVLHRCDNRRCVRAEMDQSASHLFVGTQAENLADMARKLRSGTAKLTPDDVRALRDRYAAGESLNALALSAGYAKRTVYMALTGETWAHVPGAIRLREPMRGSRHVRARLTEELVADLRRRYSAGESCKALATEIGVHYNTVEHAVSGRKWAHVPGAVALNHTRWTKPG